MLNNTEAATMSANTIPNPGTTICGCDEDAACSYHAAALYPRPDTTDTEGEYQRHAFLAATADFHIPGWTPEDEDTREHDRKIVADMIAEADADPTIRRAMLALYGEEVFERYTAADLARDLKADVKGEDL
jgi:hypothetical protein